MEYQRLDKFKVPEGFRGRPSWVVLLWMMTEALLFRPSPRIAWRWRVFLLRLFGARIGEGVRIRQSASVYYPWKLTIGSHCWIGEDCVLYSLGEIVMGDQVALAHGVYLCTGFHDIERVSFDQYEKPIRIEDQAWIANDVFVAPGVTIGKGAVIGARSTLLKSVPEGVVCYGNPARVVRKRVRGSGVQANLNPSSQARHYDVSG